MSALLLLLVCVYGCVHLRACVWARPRFVVESAAQIESAHCTDGRERPCGRNGYSYGRSLEECKERR